MARIKAGSVVCDAGPIIHLDELGYLFLLSDYTEVLLSESVHVEVKTHRPKAVEIAAVSWVIVPKKYPLSEPMKTLCRVFSLDTGEMDALAILEKRPHSTFLTDDAAARLVAVQLGFDVHGTIGILVRSLRRHLIQGEELLEVLRNVPLKSSLYIKSSLLEEVITRVERGIRPTFSSPNDR
jgi:predicted nucleic acid-binding protein